jgi:hypothetical protein
MNNSANTNFRPSRLPRGRVLGRTAAVLAIATAALPGVALAAAPKQSTFKYNVPVKRMALANGSTVAVNGKVTSPQANVKNWWSANTIKSTVQKGVNNGRQIPYTANGFRCVPVIKGARTNFACSLRGADVPTIVNFRYSIIYRGDTASG